MLTVLMKGRRIRKGKSGRLVDKVGLCQDLVARSGRVASSRQKLRWITHVSPSILVALL